MNDGERKAKASVWVVHSEWGTYSDMVYSVEGVFSSRDKAVAYIESHEKAAYHYVGDVVLDSWGQTRRVLHADNWVTDEGHYERRYPGCESTVRLVDAVRIVPTTTDGSTFAFVLPDGTTPDEDDDSTYYVTEYEVDA